jgi:hypothetical protein
MLQILLDDKSAHGMTNQDRWAGQSPSDICDVFNIFSNAGPAQVFSSFTGAMPTQIDGMNGEAMTREVLEKMDVPTPGTMHHAVDEQERRGMPTLGRILGNEFEVHRGFCPLARADDGLGPAGNAGANTRDSGRQRHRVLTRPLL